MVANNVLILFCSCKHQANYQTQAIFTTPNETQNTLFKAKPILWAFDHPADTRIGTHNKSCENLKGFLNKFFDRPRTTGKLLIPLVVSLPNHERNQLVQRFFY